MVRNQRRGHLVFLYYAAVFHPEKQRLSPDYFDPDHLRRTIGNRGGLDHRLPGMGREFCGSKRYILLQLLTVIFSITVLILWKTGVIVYPVVAFIAAAVSFVMFAGTLIFGDRRAKNELKRRFHV